MRVLHIRGGVAASLTPARPTRFPPPVALADHAWDRASIRGGGIVRLSRPFYGWWIVTGMVGTGMIFDQVSIFEERGLSATAAAAVLPVAGILAVTLVRRTPGGTLRVAEPV